MLSNASASKRLARMRRGEEILRWRYMAERAPLRRKAIGARLLALRLRHSLTAAFYKAALDIKPDAADASFEARDALRLQQALIDGTALGIAATAGRVRLLEKTLQAWERARAQNDFAVAAPHLQALVDSVRAEARHKAKEMGLASPYEALLKSRTPGFDMAAFERMAARLIPFSQGALAHKAFMPAAAAHKLPRAQQKEMQDRILARLGYRGLVAETAHPICLGTHDDVRIGMSYDEDDFLFGVLNAMHEGGHGLFRQGLPHPDRLAGQVAGVALDEAMALLMENHVARTPEFAAALARELPPGCPDAKAIFTRAATLAQEPVRLRADEVRYPLDVILRYRLEKEMIDGTLAAADLPLAWAREYEKLTGLKTPDDRSGALQDVHWFGGEFAWFPNYLLGQLAAAQLFKQAEKDLPGLAADIARADFTALRGWLTDKVYSEGARLDTFELVEKVTGRRLDTAAWERHVRRRYAPLFPPPAPRP
jgi:carboxypeptidase Taq